MGISQNKTLKQLRSGFPFRLDFFVLLLVNCFCFFVYFFWVDYQQFYGFTFKFGLLLFLLYLILKMWFRFVLIFLFFFFSSILLLFCFFPYFPCSSNRARWFSDSGYPHVNIFHLSFDLIFAQLPLKLFLLIPPHFKHFLSFANIHPRTNEGTYQPIWSNPNNNADFFFFIYV